MCEGKWQMGGVGAEGGLKEPVPNTLSHLQLIGPF